MLIAFERIAADQLGKAVGLMRIGRTHWAHFVKRDLYATLGKLPGRFSAGEAAPDYCNL